MASSINSSPLDPFHFLNQQIGSELIKKIKIQLGTNEGPDEDPWPQKESFPTEPLKGLFLGSARPFLYLPYYVQGAHRLASEIFFQKNKNNTEEWISVAYNTPIKICKNKKMEKEDFEIVKALLMGKDPKETGGRYLPPVKPVTPTKLGNSQTIVADEDSDDEIAAEYVLVEYNKDADPDAGYQYIH